MGLDIKVGENNNYSKRGPRGEEKKGGGRMVRERNVGGGDPWGMLAGSAGDFFGTG